MLKGKRGKIFLISGGLLLILLISTYVFLSFLPDIAQRIILAKLASAGIEDARLVVRHIGLESTSLANIRLGTNKDLEISEITASYSLPQLLRGHLPTITITGLRLRARLDSRGISLGSLDPLFKLSQGNGGTLLPLPFPRIELRSSKIDVLTPYGPLEVTIFLKADSIETGQMKLEASAKLQNSNAILRAKSTLVRAPDGALQGNLSFFDGRFGSDEAGFGNIQGHITLSGPTLIPTNIDGEIAFGNVRLAQTHIPGAKFNFGLKGGQAHASFRANSLKERSKVQLRAKL